MTIQLNLPDDLRQRLASRAAESGYATVEQYAEAVLRADAEGEPLPDDVEQLLTDRLDDASSGIELTTGYKDEFRRKVALRRITDGPRP